MLPDSNWNIPFVAIEEKRKEDHYKKFTLLSDLWSAPFNLALGEVASDNWSLIFKFQNDSLKKAISETSASSSFYNQLQNTCWQYGKSLSEKDWPSINIPHPHDAFLALATLSIGFLKNSDSFLLERKTKNSCTFYWLSSPIEYTELCMLYHEVFRGYLYHLSRNIRVEIHSSILPNSKEKVKAWKINLLWID
jgi:hypothetical protein